MRKRVLVIGSEGQDGIILRNFFHINDNVLAIGRFNSYMTENADFSGPGFCLDNLPLLKKIILEFSPEIVYYLAAEHGPVSSGKNLSINLESSRQFIDDFGLRQILYYLSLCNNEINFFYSASSKIFSKSVGPINELTSFSPNCLYSKSKVNAINFLESSQYSNIRIIIGILFHHHSLFRRGEYAFNLIANHYSQNNLNFSNINPINDWSKCGDFSDAVDVCNIIFRLNTSFLSGRFIIGSGCCQSLAQITSKALSMINLNFHHFINKNNISHDFCSWADISKIKNLGYKAPRSAAFSLAEQILNIRNCNDSAVSAQVKLLI